MTQNELRKLLGGYATNALSADERRSLFEAALEDQELFDALQEEDALRELLEDPVSREEVRRALQAPPREARRASFWSRRWLLGVAIPALAAVIVIAVMNRANAPRLIAPPVQIASDRVAPYANAAPPEAKPLAKKTLRAPSPDRIARATPAAAAPAPAIQAPAAVPLQSRAAMALRVAPPPTIPDAVRQRFAAGFDANAPLYQGPLVRYSLIRGGTAGDEVRVEVSVGVAGYLALYELDAAGNSTRLYPANDAAMLVPADSTMQIPGDPIKVGDAGEKLRLVLIRAVPAGVAGQLGSVGGAVNGTALGTGAAPFPPQPTPLVVDIPLGPN
jgi:hypothetical protein